MSEEASDLEREAAVEREVALEQQVLDYAHHCLGLMQRRAADVRAMSDRAVRAEDTVDAKVAQFHLKRREDALRQGTGPLCFGRIDTEDDERWYVGRRHVEDSDSKPVVVDWRAPVSAAFYRATVVDPFGLELRRRFIIEDRTITALLDEHLDDPDAPAASGLPDPLLASWNDPEPVRCATSSPPSPPSRTSSFGHRCRSC